MITVGANGVIETKERADNLRGRNIRAKDVKEKTLERMALEGKNRAESVRGVKAENVKSKKGLS